MKTLLVKICKSHLFLTLVVIAIGQFRPVKAQNQKTAGPREHILMDFDWRFAFGHPYDAKKDFNNGTSYFSYFAKAGYGDGAAAANFDDRTWRKLDLPHDWAVELPFDPKASYSHGFKAIGRNFPDASVGWYRKTFTIPESDLGRSISFAFDGVFRNSIVWVNGHYLGNEQSGYHGFEYNISEYLNYGGENTIAVRVDATMEEGWFYEGAGIYRHVWLNKTSPLHVGTNGTFVCSDVVDGDGIETVKVTVANDAQTTGTFTVKQTIYDGDNKPVAMGEIKDLSLQPFETREISSKLTVKNAHLWSVETPYRYRLVTEVISNGKLSDNYETKFGIRTIRFDANEGFFLNGKRVEIKGTNDHQDHAGVGTAIPDALQIYRVAALKALGSNAIRCSHNPPTPEFLNVCDSLGMLVIDENRLMGTSETHLGYLKKMILRDRNHPSVISWSIGNEEWGIENNITGARIAVTMQAYAKSIDSTRAITAAFSGGWGGGISAVMDLIGFNYIAQEDPDGQHKKFPLQKGWGTEEGSTFATRGAYFPDSATHAIPAYDKKPRPNAYSIEEGWNYYFKRPFLAGMFIWTGFDYRGEPTPYGWPSINSYFGMLDVCGFPKDDAWYLKAWWGDKTLLHLLPHWNWKGREGQPIDVWAYSNCDEVELFLNKKSLGKKAMPLNGHLEWKVNYKPGMLTAIGYKNGKKIAKDNVETTGDATTLKLTADKATINADRKDISIITVKINDKNNLAVPTANNLASFTIEGPGRIIGVGNGNPVSLEPDQYHEKISTEAIKNLKEKIVDATQSKIETAAGYDDSNWVRAFRTERDSAFGKTAKVITYRGSFTLPDDFEKSTITWFYNSIGKEQTLFVNGREIARGIPESKKGDVFILDKSILKAGVNSIAIVAAPILKKHSWDNINSNPGLIQILAPADQWKRKLFSGLAQVIVQSTGGPGEIKVTASADGVVGDTVTIFAK